MVPRMSHWLMLNFALCLVSVAPLFATEVPLVSHGGTYELPVRINGVITLNFVVDSGAAEVNIPADVALTLVRTGTINKNDFLPGMTYSLADGSKVESPRFTIRELEVGGHKAYNVPASIDTTSGLLLLGQSFLSRTASWSIDNQRQVFIFSGFLTNAPNQPSASDSQKAPTINSSPSAPSASDSEAIEKTVLIYYDSLQKKQIDAAINCYASERREKIKRHRLEAVAKDTEWYTINSIKVVTYSPNRADAITHLMHKKHDQQPESWEITLQLAKDGHDWKIIGTSGNIVTGIDQNASNSTISATPTTQTASAVKTMAPRNPTVNEAESLKKSVQNFLSAYEQKDVEGVLACWKQDKRKDISVDFIRDKAKSTESYTIKRLLIHYIEGEKANITAYVAEKKYAGEPESYKMDIIFYNEKGEWKIESIVNDKIYNYSILSNDRAHGLYIFNNQDEEWKEIKLSQMNEELVSVVAKISGEECIGDLHAIGSYKDGKITKLQVIDDDGSSNDYKCDIIIIVEKDFLQAEELGCSGWHGFRCDFSGKYKKIGVEVE